MNQQIQEKYIELQMLEQQMQQVQKQLQLLEQQSVELNSTKEAIATLAKTKTGTEVLVPISQGIFFKAQLKDNKDLTVNVGSEVGVKKSIEESQKLVENQLVEMIKFQQELTSNLQKLASKAQDLEKELSKLNE